MVRLRFLLSTPTLSPLNTSIFSFIFASDLSMLLFVALGTSFTASSNTACILDISAGLKGDAVMKGKVS